jgi:serine/threonine protein kinase
MTTKQIDRETFLAHVRQSGLLSADQVAQVARDVPAAANGRTVARALVERGLLTKFQAELLLAGRTGGFLLGRYRILEQLGRGGMGRVFKAVHVAMDRVVALKVLSASLLKTERARQLFQREVRAAAKLIHPNIVTAYDADRAAETDRHYLVMEFVDGPNLDQLVKDQGPLPVAEACDLVRQVANGLQFAADHGMVHRDIKPANLLVQRGQGPHPEHLVKILDFGLARLHEPDQGLPSAKLGSIEAGENVVLGTPDFLSPEQARDLHEADIRSDIYSLGCTLYYLLTGRVPFPGGGVMEKLIRHSTEQPEPIEQLRPEVPAAVAAIVRRMMAREPAARFQTPAEVAAALAPFARAGDWAMPELHAPSVDAATTPANIDLPPDSPFVGGAGAEEAAVGTVLSDRGTLSDAPARRPSAFAEQQRRLAIALGVAFGILGVGIVLGAVVVWLLAR